MLEIPLFCCAQQLVLFFFCSRAKTDSIAVVMLHCILWYCLPIHHAWTSRTAHDKRKFNFKRMTSEIIHLWACDKTIFRIEIQKQKKQTNEKSEFYMAVFSAATDSEHKISSNTTQIRTKQNLVSIFIVRTGAYL